jgi:hypothetical protein
MKLLKFVLLLAAVLRSSPAVAGVAAELKHFIAAPPGIRAYENFGRAVAANGAYAVAGGVRGIVEVFDSNTGTLLHVLYGPPHPTAGTSGFGCTVGVVGSILVVGALVDYNGAESAGSVYVFDLAGPSPAVPVHVFRNPDPAAGDSFGSSVAIWGDHIVVGAWGDDTGADRAGSAYVYNLRGIDPTVPVAVLRNPTPGASDEFGQYVAISDSRVVVGAPYDDDQSANAGAVYVYDIAGLNNPLPVMVLYNPEPTAFDYFGSALAVSGSRLVVGARGDDFAASSAGSAYVYDLTRTNPTQPVARLRNPDPEAVDEFGGAVTVAGSLVAIGANKDNTGAVDAGSAYVFNLAAPNPSVPFVTLRNPQPAAGDSTGDYYGASVALHGSRLWVAATGEDGETTNTGIVYGYDLAGAIPAVPVITAAGHPTASTEDHFGQVLALAGPRLVVGVPGDNTGASKTGSVYIYNVASGLPGVPTAVLRNPEPAVEDEFGNAVAVSGSRVVVAAHKDDAGRIINNPGSANGGSVYVFDLDSATPTLPALSIHNPQPAGLDSVQGDSFGEAIALSGSLLVVGAPYDDSAADNAGGAYVYNLDSANPSVPLLTLPNPTPQTSEFFGWSVAISGHHIAVAEDWDDTGARDTGSVYLFDLTSPSPQIPVLTINNPDPAVFDIFGFKIVLDGSRLVVGCIRDDEGAVDAGSVYVYQLDSASPSVPVLKLHHPAPAVEEAFGYALVLSGDRLVVGAARSDAGEVDAGSAYVYDLAGPSPTVPVATLTSPSPAELDYFGTAVAIDGSTVVVGAPNDDATNTDQGAVCIFELTTTPADADGDGLRDAWEIAQFGAATGHSALDDFDADGYNELLELAFGQNPTISSPGGLPPVTSEGGYLTMTLVKQPGVTYEVQSAGTLQPALPNSFSAASTTVLVHDATTLKVRDNYLIGTGLRRFLRVKVTAAP